MLLVLALVTISCCTTASNLRAHGRIEVNRGGRRAYKGGETCPAIVDRSLLVKDVSVSRCLSGLDSKGVLCRRHGLRGPHTRGLRASIQASVCERSRRLGAGRPSQRTRIRRPGSPGRGREYRAQITTSLSSVGSATATTATTTVVSRHHSTETRYFLGEKKECLPR